MYKLLLMNYRIYPTPEFKRLFKKLLKKHPSLKSDFQLLIAKLSENPQIGISLGYGIYKIRFAISSKDKGKSSGARLITFIVHKEKEVYLVYIYDKNQLENITKQQVLKILQKSGLIE